MLDIKETNKSIQEHSIWSQLKGIFVASAKIYIYISNLIYVNLIRFYNMTHDLCLFKVSGQIEHRPEPAGYFNVERLSPLE